MDKFDGRILTIENNSPNTIYGIMLNNNLESYTNLNSMGTLISDSIISNEKYSKLGTKLWKDYIDISDNKKLRLYIIEKDSVDKYGWEGIQAKNIYNKKYTLDIDDLDSLKWTIEYNDN